MPVSTSLLFSARVRRPKRLLLRWQQLPLPLQLRPQPAPRRQLTISPLTWSSGSRGWAKRLLALVRDLAQDRGPVQVLRRHLVRRAAAAVAAAARSERWRTLRVLAVAAVAVA